MMISVFLNYFKMGSPLSSSISYLLNKFAVILGSIIILKIVFKNIETFFDIDINRFDIIHQIIVLFLS